MAARGAEGLASFQRLEGPPRYPAICLTHMGCSLCSDPHTCVGLVCASHGCDQGAEKCSRWLMAVAHVSRSQNFWPAAAPPTWFACAHVRARRADIEDVGAYWRLVPLQHVLLPPERCIADIDHLRNSALEIFLKEQLHASSHTSPWTLIHFHQTATHLSGPRLASGITYRPIIELHAIGIKEWVQSSKGAGRTDSSGATHVGQPNGAAEPGHN